LIRHETCCNYQYEDAEFDKDSPQQYVDQEGYQNVTNTISFVSDVNHEWLIENEKS